MIPATPTANNSFIAGASKPDRMGKTKNNVSINCVDAKQQCNCRIMAQTWLDMIHNVYIKPAEQHSESISEHRILTILNSHTHSSHKRGTIKSRSRNETSNTINEVEEK
jgi:hypothetical protein